jgi:hypothetical protein
MTQSRAASQLAAQRPCSHIWDSPFHADTRGADHNPLADNTQNPGGPQSMRQPSLRGTYGAHPVTGQVPASQQQTPRGESHKQHQTYSCMAGTLATSNTDAEPRSPISQPIGKHWETSNCDGCTPESWPATALALSTAACRKSHTLHQARHHPAASSYDTP